MVNPKPPNSTYRLQFNSQFTLRHALELVPYLKSLGITHIYASPLVQAVPGSTHGYDVCDFQQLNPELGTPDDFNVFVNSLHQAGLGLIVDLVPNHMAANAANRWWWDVLKHGKASNYSDFFDIDWHHPHCQLHGKVLLPVLNDRYGRFLEKQLFRIEKKDSESVLSFDGRHLPIDPASCPDAIHPASTKGIDELLEKQNYRLTFWRRAQTELNYRRFFAIDSLVGLRVDEPLVFQEVHSLLVQWLAAGKLAGLRVDHIDGLRDPERYLERLRELAPQCWIVVEKILAPGESLPKSWPIQGTTGYDFLNRVQELFVHPKGAGPLSELNQEFTGNAVLYPHYALAKKRQVLLQLFIPEVRRLAALLTALTEERWKYRDFTAEEFQAAIVAIASAFPVYRTYTQPATGKVAESDRHRIDEALRMARAAEETLDELLIQCLENVLTLKWRGPLETEFVLRFQQLTGAVMAKGVEDTAFYTFNRLLALNEVGGSPGEFGGSIEGFHRASLQSQKNWPAAMLTTSTHDTKRGEDLRARLNVLSEMPQHWEAAVMRWAKTNEPYHTGGFPDRNMEYHFYQTLVGAWPLNAERAWAYMEKAAREAKVHTTWHDRHAPYEEALKRFVEGALSDESFINDVAAFANSIAVPGWINSLSQTLIKLTAPGVPDCYQGTELWDFSLVDPDNRRPVDYALRQRLLHEMAGLSINQIWDRRAEGLPKLWLLRQALALRNRNPQWFGRDSTYAPLAASGPEAEHVIAFQRGNALIVVPRFVYSLVKADTKARGNVFEQNFLKNWALHWEDTRLSLPAGTWLNELTHEFVSGPELKVGRLLAKFPVALLSAIESH